MPRSFVELLVWVGATKALIPSHFVPQDLIEMLLAGALVLGYVWIRKQEEMNDAQPSAER